MSANLHMLEMVAAPPGTHLFFFPEMCGPQDSTIIRSEDRTGNGNW